MTSREYYAKYIKFSHTKSLLQSDSLPLETGHQYMDSLTINFALKEFLPNVQCYYRRKKMIDQLHVYFARKVLSSYPIGPKFVQQGGTMIKAIRPTKIIEKYFSTQNIFSKSQSIKCLNFSIEKYCKSALKFTKINTCIFKQQGFQSNIFSSKQNVISINIARFSVKKYFSDLRMIIHTLAVWVDQ